MPIKNENHSHYMKGYNCGLKKGEARRGRLRDAEKILKALSEFKKADDLDTVSYLKWEVELFILVSKANAYFAMYGLPF